MKILKTAHIFATLILATINFGFSQTLESSKPNIIIIFTDDQGYGDLSCYGATDLKTPNIDNLANNGILFQQFYVPASVCTPSRAALLTGKYPKRVGLHNEVVYPYSTHGLSPDEVTLAERLKQQGYKTACVGKWHLGHQPQFMSNNQGFDYFFGVPYSNDMDGYFYEKNQYQSPPLPIYLNETIVEAGINQDLLTQKWTNAAVNFIGENTNTPFFLYLAHNMPHVPWHASEAFKNTSNRGLYGDVIQELDWSVGEIVKTLKEKQLLNNTIIIFTSDNGPVTTLKDGGSAGPLRGRKATTWEGGMRVPGIISWPAQIPKGIVTNVPVSTLDIVPTLTDITGGQLPNKKELDGRDIKDFILNPTEPFNKKFEMLYYGRNGNLEAYTNGKWKLHIKKDIGWPNGEEVFPVSLFNLKDDIGEKNNIASNNPKLVKKLSKRMKHIDVSITPKNRK
ncbi:MAG: sulfatase [Flavobacteriaceae bacterium]